MSGPRGVLEGSKDSDVVYVKRNCSDVEPHIIFIVMKQALCNLMLISNVSWHRVSQKTQKAFSIVFRVAPGWFRSTH